MQSILRIIKFSKTQLLKN